MWGVQQVLPCDIFKNPENGYIFCEGTLTVQENPNSFNHPRAGYLFYPGPCKFGVDVIVAPPLPTNNEILSFDESFGKHKFSWAFKNFPELKKIERSDIFSMGGRKW